MKKSQLTLINPKGLYDSSMFYSQMAQLTMPAQLIFIAGQAGEDETGKRSADFATQVRQSFENIRTALNSTHADMVHIVKLTVLIAHLSEERLMIYQKALEYFFGENKPTCTLIPVTQLALPDMQFEVEAIAYAPMEA